LKKKIFSIAVCLLLVVSLFGCLVGAAGPKPVTIKIFMGSPEYSDAMNALVKEYKKVAPNVTIQLEIMQSDLPTILKARIAAGNIPDVFQTTAGGEIEAYAEYSADLTKEPLAKAMTSTIRNDMSYNGKVLGLPIKGNVFAMVYNKALFERAGITAIPKTMSQMEDACKKLEAKGITPFGNGYKEWWVHKHVFQHFLDAAGNDPGKLVADFIAGKTTFKDHPILYQYFDFVDLTVKYGLPKPLECDFNGEVSAIGTGKVAMITGQGAWAEEGILKMDPSIKLGIMGYPVNNDPKNSKIIYGADQAIRIAKDSKVLAETKKFFNWMYTSNYGKNTWFPKVAKVVPPIVDAPAPDLQIPKAAQEIMKKEPAGALAINYSLDSFHQKFGEIIQAYIAKAKTRDEAVNEIQQAWIKLGGVK
jgi:raffinose/stachyose/melibiose transport system substrate-binding protein